MDKYKQRKRRKKSKPHLKKGKFRNKFSPYRIEKSKTQKKKNGRLNKQKNCKSVLLILLSYN